MQICNTDRNCSVSRRGTRRLLRFAPSSNSPRGVGGVSWLPVEMDPTGAGDWCGSHWASVVRRNKLRLLLASSSLAALLIGGGTPPAHAAACAINDVANSAGAGPFTNSVAINCINIQNSAVNQAGGNSVTNAAGGTTTAVGAALPTASGITINNSSLAGSILNAGTITASTAGPGNGIIVTNNATLPPGSPIPGLFRRQNSDGIIVGGNATGAVTDRLDFDLRRRHHQCRQDFGQPATASSSAAADRVTADRSRFRIFLAASPIAGTIALGRENVGIPGRRQHDRQRQRDHGFNVRRWRYQQAVRLRGAATPEASLPAVTGIGNGSYRQAADLHRRHHQ